MTEYVPCSVCGEVVTPIGEVCFDCAYPDKKDRQLQSQCLRAARAAAHESLRDRFAMAALAALQLPAGTWCPEQVVPKAYAIADAMILARVKP
jgi:hypothetical protein